MVGIDFDNIFWSVTEVEKQKCFVLSIVQKAIDEKVWKKTRF